MKKKILILAANPADTTQLRLGEEVRKIKNARRQATNGQEIQIFNEWVRVDDLRQVLFEHKPNVVHFCGHGEGDNGLVLENEDGKKQLVSSESLAGLFKNFQEYVDCVVLNACYSEAQAKAIHEHINCVIGMNQSISDKAAIEFATGFYEALTNGANYKKSFDLGCNAIDLKNIPESQKPQIKIKDTSKTFIDPNLIESESNYPELLFSLFRNGEISDSKKTLNVNCRNNTINININKASDNQEFFLGLENAENKEDIIESIRKDFFTIMSRKHSDMLSDWGEEIRNTKDLSNLINLIIDFINHIPQKEDSKISPSLDFIYRLTKNKNIPEDIREKFKQKLPDYPFETNDQNTSTQLLHSYLLIQLRPGVDKELFLKAWFIPDDNIHDPIKRFKPLDVEELKTEICLEPEQLEKKLPKLLGDLIEQCFPGEQKRELTIEIFLPPNRLWDEEVEKWELLDFEKNHKIIGSYYRVVVRSYERMKNRIKKQGKELHQQWREKWLIVEENLNNHCISIDKELVIKLDKNYFTNLNSSQLTTLLRKKIVVQICCNLSNSQRNTLLSAVHSAGTPIVILSRRFDIYNEINISNEIHKLLEKPLHQLPDLVKEQRSLAQERSLLLKLEHSSPKKTTLKADDDCNYLGHHLVLLWDNPNRLPLNPKDYPLEPLQIPA